MKPTIAVAGCSTISAELSQCCRQLGLPAKLYASRPACLFGVPREDFEALLARADSHSDALLVALGQCCGEFEIEGAGAVSASRCTEMLLGQGTFGWLAEHGVLPLPPPYFSTWLKHPAGPAAVQQALVASPAAAAVRSIAAVDGPCRSPDPAGLAEIERISGRPSRRVRTGLGHMREYLRRAAALMGLSPGRIEPEALSPAELGPGDDCLILKRDPGLAWEAALGIVTQSLDRGVRCVWITDGARPTAVRDRLLTAVPGLKAALDAGRLEIVDPASLMAQTNAASEPQFLVAHWIRLATDALAAGDSGLCLLHSSGWTEAAGLPVEYVLAYAARLSAACAHWPISSFSECAPAEEPGLLDELARTHPLVWRNGLVHVSPEFVDSEEYLGSEELLEKLGHEPVHFTCDQAQPLLSALSDGELEGPAAVALAQHVQGCATCEQRLAQHRAMKGSLAALRRSVEGVADDLWTRISREIQTDA